MSRASMQTGRAPFLPPAMAAAMRRHAWALLGLSLVALGLALVVAMIGYSPVDPSPNRATDGPVQNLLGLPGAYASDILLRTLGLGAVVVAAILGSWGWRIATHRGISLFTTRLSVAPLAVLLTATSFADVPPPAAWPLHEGLGGVLGTLALDRLTGLIGGVGIPINDSATALAAGFAAVAAFAYALGFNPSEWRVFFGHVGHALRWSAAALATVFAWGNAAAAHLKRLRTGSGPAAEAPERARTEARRAPRPETVQREEVRPEEARSVVVKPKPASTARRQRAAAQKNLPFEDGYQLPPIDLLELPNDNRERNKVDEEALSQNARLLESVLDDFGVRGEIVKVRPGPVVTLYELEPAPGTKASRVIGLADDIARYMSAVSVRVAVVPGRNVIGIELPNRNRETVYLRELLSSQAYDSSTASLPLVLGKDIGGGPIIANLERMPHLLIAGTTGSGKSVAINTMILSLLYRLTPEQCRFIMIDPKMLELSVYDDIPHLLSPVVTDPRKAVVALKWVVREMENRYRAMSTFGVRNIGGYNARLEEARQKGEVLTRRVQTGFDPDTGKPVFEDQVLDSTPLPYIVVVVDEMADLMMVAGKDIEAAIQRLAQMARAAGIHIIMATQRPSVDVITGTIKANFPTRVSFQVTSKVDSRTILGEGGAEQLLGQGDMLYMAGGGRISRVHGPFVTDAEVEEIVAFLKQQGEPAYLDAITEDEDVATGIPGFEESGAGNDGDDLYNRAVALVARERKASTSFVQRHLQIGYNRAARIIEQMEADGVISAANHVGKREVLLGGGGDD